MVDFHEKLQQRLTDIQGVEAAGAVWRLPLNGRGANTSFQFEDAGLPYREWPSVAFNMVDPSYFAALHIPLIAGRRFSWETDKVGRPLVILVNRAFETTYGAGVIGKRLQLRFWTDLVPKNQLWQIAGVVGDAYQGGLDQAVRPQIYLPVSQTGLDGGVYVIRSSRTDASFSSAIAAAVRVVDPDLERIRVRRLDDWVSQSLGDRRFPAVLTALFAAIGLALAALGIYGVVALEVGERRKEMAIRIALGASRSSIRALVLRRGVLLAALGAIVGAAGFVAVGRVIEAQLYELSPSDPVNAVVVVAVLFVCTVCACLLPARAALRQQPISILREI